jgi:hypothetical protein
VEIGVGLLALVPILFGILLAFAVISLGDKHQVLKIFLFLTAFVMIVPALWLGSLAVIKYAPEWTEMADAMAKLTFYFGILFVVMVMYWLIYGFYTMVHAIAQKKGEQAELKYG